MELFQFIKLLESTTDKEEILADMHPVFSISTSSREISVVQVDWCIFPYHEIGILTGRQGGEGGKAMSSRED